MDKQGFTAYLEGKGLAPATIAHYVKVAALFFKWAKKEDIQVTKPDVLRYLEHLKKNTKQQNITRWHACIALKHYFNALQQANMISHNPVALIKIRGTYKKRLYKIYTPDELTELADNFYAIFISGFDDSRMDKDKKQKSFLSRQRNYAMLTLLLYQGLTTQELPKINLNDIDLNKARLTLNNGTTIRNLPIQATQIGTLINYINNIRPLYLDYCKGETDKLFFALSAEQYDKTFIAPLKKFKKQIKSIDRNFINFVQIRTSVITHWIQTEGLRKAQYLAGHRSIASTEMYLPNDLNSLMNDIQKFNPF